MKLYRVEVIRYIRQYATVYMLANDEELGLVIDPQISENIKDKADNIGFETDWEYVSDYDISDVQEVGEGDGVDEGALICLEETDNG